MARTKQTARRSDTATEPRLIEPVSTLPAVLSHPLDLPTSQAARALFDAQVDAQTRRICGPKAPECPPPAKKAKKAKTPAHKH